MSESIYSDDVDEAFIISFMFETWVIDTLNRDPRAL